MSDIEENTAKDLTSKSIKIQVNIVDAESSIDQEAKVLRQVD